MPQINKPEKRWLVIVNPNAGRRKGLIDWEKISGLLEHYNLKFTPIFTERPGHATELTNNLIEEKGYQKIVVVGGDGTMNEVVNGVFSQKRFKTTDITLGMITVGTGNDWGRMFGIPSNYESAVQILTRDQTFTQDAGMVRYCNEDEPGNRYFVNIAGMGFDAEVCRKSNRSKEKGRGGVLLYFINIFTSLVNYRHVEALINVDGFNMENKIFSMNVGICKFSGGGMINAPNAIPDDGLFDLTVINKLSKGNVILSLKRLYNGTIDKHPKVESFTGKSIRVESKDTIHLETDGESIGHTPLEFSIIPKSIKILTGYFNN
ncbi:diacylglycerol/lipid kinase family protein [Bacteroidota bacterium]